MIGKVYQIGYIKRKKVPVLIQEVNDHPEWYYIFYRTEHLENAFLARFFLGFSYSHLVNFLDKCTRCVFEAQTVEFYPRLFMRLFHQKSQVFNSGLYFIPVELVSFQHVFRTEEYGPQHVYLRTIRFRADAEKLECSEFINPLYTKLFKKVK